MADQESASEASQTAADFISSQLQLEADAREALPYVRRDEAMLMQQFDTCTNVLGPLRQTVFSCLTCGGSAGVCYACSISCHGEHELVELFTRRNFVCDCGTTRLPATSPCSLRMNSNGQKGVHSEDPPHNSYNHNFRNKFCACGEEYDPQTEKGTMFQCLGLGTIEQDGCGEDWYHPECIMGLGRVRESQNPAGSKELEYSLPPGFPAEDDFEHLLCFKCVDANPWIKRYTGTVLSVARSTEFEPAAAGTKRKADDLESAPKKSKLDDDVAKCKLDTLPLASPGQVSLFLKEDFREHLCRCAACFPLLAPHPQLLEEETVYEPPISESSEDEGTGSVGSKSLFDRGEAALSNMDRVRAIEGVMAYNKLRDNLKAFLKPFAETGTAVGAEDIKKHFEKLRGDDQAIREAQLKGGVADSS